MTSPQKAADEERDDRLKIVFATRNPGKLKELTALLADVPVRLLTLDDVGFGGEVVEDRDSFEGNARKKAEEVANATGYMTLADDSGLEVDALGGEPGVISARYAVVREVPGISPRATDPTQTAANNAKLLEALAHVAGPRTARFRCVLALARPGEVLGVDQGVCEGEIARAPRGEGGFGYDPLFVVASLGRTMAELTMEEKNQVSHRAQAMRRMARRLAALLQERDE